MSPAFQNLSIFLLEEGLGLSGAGVERVQVQNWENIWTQSSAQCKETFSTTQVQAHLQLQWD